MMIFVQGLHAKLVQEQESWTEELKCKQEVLAKHTKLLENKEAEIKRDLEILTEERRLAINEIKRFAEMESRIWEAERDLQTKHEQHLQEVSKPNKQFLSSSFQWVPAKSVGGATVESILVMSFLYDRSCTWICPVIPGHLTMCISLSLCRYRNIQMSTMHMWKTWRRLSRRWRKSLQNCMRRNRSFRFGAVKPKRLCRIGLIALSKERRS
jgi:hypothetical protein